MKKKVIKLFKFFLILLITLILPACNGENTMKDDLFKIKFVKNSDNEYYLKINKNGLNYVTKDGAIGVRFDKNEFRAEDPIYTNYLFYEEVLGGYHAYGEINSLSGTKIGFNDYFSVVNNSLIVDRKFEVIEVGLELGFTTEFKLTNENKGSILDSEWFIPANNYINGENTFNTTSSRIYFNGLNMVIPAEDTSALLATQYYNQKSFTMTDLTPGYRENVIDDNNSFETVLFINENINLPGIGISESEEKISFSHLYPSYTNKSRDRFIWRLLPVEKNLKKEVSFSIRIGTETTYDEALKNSWRNAYDSFSVIDKRYDVNDVYEMFIEMIDQSYSDKEWGGIPQYMTTLDHYFPDSGFLYRNLELGTLMLKEGRKRDNQEMIINAINVIEHQIINDKIDRNISAYERSNSVFYRVLFDGLESLVKFYINEYDYMGDNHKLDDGFLNGIYAYIVEKAQLYQNTESAMALSFYAEIVKNKDILFLDYDDVLINLAENTYNSIKNYQGYYGGIESSNPLLSVTEEYMIFLRAFLDIYELTNEKIWLDRSVKIGDYLETYHMIQMMNLNLIGSTGLEGFNLAFMGNERFTAHGYIFNNTQHGILDIANASSVIDYYRLYKYTNDSHYLDYATMKLYNTMIYINMGDKVGHMDDLLNSGGLGFMNEFVGNSTFNSNFVEGGIRGAAHDSNIAWNVYQIISIFDWFNEKHDNLLPKEIDESLNHDISKRRYIKSSSTLNPIYNPNKVLDNNLNTGWIPEYDDHDKHLIIDFNEYVNIEKINITSKDSILKSLSISNDGVNFVDIEYTISYDDNDKMEIDLKTQGKYLKIAFNEVEIVNLVNVIGYPVLYETLSYNSQILFSSDNSVNATKSLDPMNYNTAWDTKSNTNVILILDLGEVHDIYQTALKFRLDLDNVTSYQYKIEISIDNENYVIYADNSTNTLSKLVYIDQAFAEARYVKLTLISSEDERNFVLEDFKIMGK